jgi:ATP adenylyltransferase
MQHLFTPWRFAYITGAAAPKDGSCVFCGKRHGTPEADAAALIVGRSEHVYVMLNLYPYSSGHLMVVPYEHVATQEEMPVEALTDIMLTVNKALGVLRKVYNPHAFNLGVNLGAAAGAGIAAHYHFHIVPRWANDVNFMTAVGDTRVIPEAMDVAHAKLSAAWTAVDNSR